MSGFLSEALSNACAVILFAVVVLAAIRLFSE